MRLTTAIDQMDYGELTQEIKRTMRRSAKDIVRVGYMLRRVSDERIWEREYGCFEEYLEKELHLEYTLASRFMAISRKYSLPDAGMEIREEYAGYSQAVLIEMLNMPPELEAKVRPEMTVREVREIKREAKKKRSQAASSEGSGDQLHDENWIIEEFERIEPAIAEGIREVYYGEDDKGKRAEAVREYLTSGAAMHSGCAEYAFDFHAFAKGLDLRVGTERRRFTYARFAKLIAGKEKIATSQGETAREEVLSAYGLPKTVYPEGSLLTSEGCGNKYHCFSCAMDGCDIRQKSRYCCEAPFGSPFACKMVDVLDDIRWDRDVKDRCQFLNDSLASHKAGNGEADPCCKECREVCDYRCARSLKSIADEKKKEEETGQLKMPKLKNTDQRKEWLKNYKEWGLWYRDENIDVNYYKYDFEDGSRLVAEEYPQRRNYRGVRDEYYFHLIEKNKKGYNGERYDGKYERSPNCETCLVEFLKDMQKGR